jgi:hypothetical protein
VLREIVSGDRVGDDEGAFGGALAGSMRHDDYAAAPPRERLRRPYVIALQPDQNARILPLHTALETQ